jgi:hypothetical protein
MLNMTVRSGSLLGLMLLAGLIAAPALATPHSGGDKLSPNKRVVLLSGSHDRGLHLGFVPWSVRFDLRELIRQHRERQHALLMAWLRRHRVSPPSTEPSPGGGGVFPPSVGGDTGQVPMPEPGAALLFALGTGMVALYLKRPQPA